MQLTLYIDVARNRLVSALNASTLIDPLSLPLFVGDKLQLQVYLMTPLQTQQPSIPQYSIVSTLGLALGLYLTNGQDSNAVGYVAYTWQVAWNTDPNNTYFYATLDLTQAALVTLLGSNTSASCYLVVGYVQGGVDTTVFYKPVTVQPGLPNAVGPPLAGLTPLSAEAAAQMFVPINGGAAGQSFIMLTPLGKRLLIQAVDNADGTISFQASPM